MTQLIMVERSYLQGQKSAFFFHLDKDSAAGPVNHCSWEGSHSNRPDLFLSAMTIGEVASFRRGL